MDERQLALRNARLIAVALPLGVVLFWAIAWYLTDAGQRGMSPGLLRADVASLIWAVVALGGVGIAFLFRGRALQGAEGAAAGPDTGSASRVLTNLIVAWALLEVQALLAGVLFLLLVTNGLLVAAACVYMAGLELTFPRAQWFGVGDAGG